MVDFSQLASRMDQVVDAHLTDPALLRSISLAADARISVILEHPSEADTFGQASFARARPWLEVSVRQVPILQRGDVVLMGSEWPREGWRIASTPLRPGDGAYWRADVEPIGIVLA